MAISRALYGINDQPTAKNYALAQVTTFLDDKIEVDDDPSSKGSTSTRAVYTDTGETEPANALKVVVSRSFDPKQNLTRGSLTVTAQVVQNKSSIDEVTREPIVATISFSHKGQAMEHDYIMRTIEAAAALLLGLPNASTGVPAGTPVSRLIYGTPHVF